MLKKIALALIVATSFSFAPSSIFAQPPAQQNVTAFNPVNTPYYQHVAKVANDAWMKNFVTRAKTTFTAGVAIYVDRAGITSCKIVGSSRNSDFDREVIKNCSQLNAGTPPATWDYEKPVNMYYHSIANFKERGVTVKAAIAQSREGVTLYNKNLLDDAIVHFQKAVQLDPQLAIAYANLGSAQFLQAKYEDAIQSFTKGLALDPEDDEVRFVLARAYLKLNRVSEAKKLAGAVVPSSKFYQQAQDMIAGKGEYSLEYNSTDPNVVYGKAVELANKDENEESIKYYKRTIELDPTFQQAYTFMGSAYFSLQRMPEAMRVLETALRLNPADDDANYMLGCAYSNDNRVQEGLALLKKVKPDSRNYQGAQDAIKNARTAMAPAQQQANQTTTETVVTTDNSLVKDKWALVIGISKFANPEYNLKFAAKDAQDFYNYLITDGHFQKDHVLLLLNERATRRNIMSAFGDKFLPAVCRDGDLVTIYISTHGTPASKDPGKRNFIIAYDTEAEALYETGVDMDELYRRVKEGVKTERALIVMDTCYSGAGVPGARGVDVGANFDAAQFALGSGHLVMTSSSPAERSWESKVTPNGVFTKYLIQNLKLTKGNVKNSFDKLKGDVGWEVQNAFNQSQSPQMGGEWKGKDLILNAIPTESRPILNPELLKLINPPELPKLAPKTVPVRNRN